MTSVSAFATRGSSLEFEIIPKTNITINKIEVSYEPTFFLSSDCRGTIDEYGNYEAPETLRNLEMIEGQNTYNISKKISDKCRSKLAEIHIYVSMIDGPDLLKERISLYAIDEWVRPLRTLFNAKCEIDYRRSGSKQLICMNGLPGRFLETERRISLDFTLPMPNYDKD